MLPASDHPLEEAFSSDHNSSGLSTVNLCSSGSFRLSGYLYQLGCAGGHSSDRVAAIDHEVGITLAEDQLKSFIGKFDAKTQGLIRATRTAMRKQLATANELVYDNYNFFVIGYCPSERPSEAFVSIAAAANGVSLMFLRGAGLPDPHKLLQGSGKLNRSLKIKSATDLDRWEVRSLISEAAAQAGLPRIAAGKPKLIIRSVSKKQRPRKRTTA